MNAAPTKERKRPLGRLSLSLVYARARACVCVCVDKRPDRVSVVTAIVPQRAYAFAADVDKMLTDALFDAAPTHFDVEASVQSPCR